MMNSRYLLLVWALGGGIGCSRANQDGQRPPQQASHAATLAQLDLPGIPNAVRHHAHVVSGGIPADDQAFRALQSLGVRTLISVDGAQPDAARARRFGMRYVHLPHGYDGISKQRGMELAKAVRELPGPIYIHCHHGKHRSPAAAAVACIATGLVRPEDGPTLLATAGTSPDYRGLFASVVQAARIDDSALRDLQVEFRERVPLPPMAEAMVEIEQVFDSLTAIAEADWRPQPEHPERDAAHQALLLREHFTELLRTKETQEAPESFGDLMRSGESLAAELEKRLRVRAADATGEAEWSAGPPQEPWDQLVNNCTTCHRQHRDDPAR